jgi:hypothetical protein
MNIDQNIYIDRNANIDQCIYIEQNIHIDQIVLPIPEPILTKLILYEKLLFHSPTFVSFFEMTTCT